MNSLYSPLTLQILLHAHCRPTPYGELEPDHQRSPAVAEAIQRLLEADMIIRDGKDMVFTTTDRAKTFIDYLMALPFPELSWSMSSTQQGDGA